MFNSLEVQTEPVNRIGRATARTADHKVLPAVPLSAICTGQEVVLVRLDGGRQFLHRLAEMGLRPGVRFKMISRGLKGPFIISLKDGRLVLGRGMVTRVHVRPIV